MRRLLQILAALLVSGGCAGPSLVPSAASDAAALSLASECYRLPNGLQVILREDHRLPVVSVNLWYRVGARDEAARLTGFAHLFEHLMFMGTERVPSFDTLLEAGGAGNNADTTADRTDFYSWGPSSFLPTLLWVEADRMEGLGRAMTQAKLDLQREVVLNERRQNGENSPYGKAELQVAGWMYPAGHPYAHPVIGSAEDIRFASVEDVKRFFFAHYLPNNASLAVVGDFETDRVKALIGGLFGGLPAGPRPPETASVPVALNRELRRLERDQVQQARLSWIWHSPAAFSPGDAEMDLAAQILAGGRNSRLYRRLVIQEALAQDVSAWQASQKLGSLFRVDVTALATSTGDDLARIEKAVSEELEAFISRGPSDGELSRAVAGLEARTLRDLQDPQAMAARLNFYAETLGTPDGLERDLGRYRSAIPSRVRDRSREVLDPVRRLVLTVLPEGSSGPSALERAPEPFAAKAFVPPPPRILTLANGLTVWHLERHDLPLVRAVLSVPAGSAGDGVGRFGLASLASGMLTEGAGDLPAGEFQDALERMGSTLDAGASLEVSTLCLNTLTRHADASFRLMDLALRHPRFDPDAWERAKRLRLAALDQALDDPDSVARRTAMQAFFGAEHPYGHPPDGVKTDVLALTLEDARTFWKGRYVPKGATLMVAGDLDTAGLDRLLEDTFARWEGPDAGTPAPIPQRPAGRRLVLVDRPGAAQTEVGFYWPGPLRRDPDRVALKVLNTVLGGTFLSRLNANLREKNGYTYGVSSGIRIFRGDACWLASAAVQTEVTGKALGEFLSEFRRLGSGDVREEEAAKACAALRQGMVQGFGTLEGILGLWSEPVQHAEGPEALAKDLAGLDGCDAARLNRLASTFKPEEGILVLVGDKDRILPQLEGLGLPEPGIVSPK